MHVGSDRQHTTSNLRTHTPIPSPQQLTLPSGRTASRTSGRGGEKLEVDSMEVAGVLLPLMLPWAG